MSRREQFGLRDQNEVRPEFTVVDPRRPSQKLADGLRNPKAIAFTFFGMAVVGLMVVQVSSILPIFALLLLATHKVMPSNIRRSSSFLPMRAPVQEGGKREFKQLGMPETGLQRSTGIFCIGREIETGREIWMSNEDVREHFWVAGTTGAGKTELLMAMVMNCLTWGSGCVYIDGKGDIKTAIKIWKMCRVMGRTDDFYLLNFMVPKTGIAGAGKLSHTMNPFASYTKAEIMSVIESLLPKAQGDASSWQAKAVALMNGVVTVLVWLRDHHGVPLNVQSIQDGMVLDNILRTLLPREICNPIYRDMPPEVRSPLLNYANNLSSFPRDLLQMPPDGSPHPLAKPGSPYKFVDQTNTQHGFLTSILGPPLALLGESYRHIFSTQYADIDIFDITLNRRLLVAILPAMQKSLEEMGNLGRIVVSTLKTMLGDSLGHQFEGTISKTELQRMTVAPSPFLTILDEWTYYITAGAAMMPAQGRSLGFSFVFAVQSLTAVFKRDDVEARDAYGTVNTRVFMFAVDEDTTIKSAIESAGRGDVARQKGMTYKQGVLATNIDRNPDSTIEQTERLSSRDIRKLGKGEFFMLRGDVKLMGIGLYIEDDSLAAPDSVTKYDIHHTNRLNHMVAIMPESAEEIAKKNAVAKYVALLSGDSPDVLEKMFALHRGEDEIGVVSLVLTRLPELDLIDASCVALARVSIEIQAARSTILSGGRGGPMSGVGGALPDFIETETPAPKRRSNSQRSRVNFSDEADEPHATRVGGKVNDTTSRAIAGMDAASTDAEMDAAIADAIGTKNVKISRRRAAIDHDADRPDFHDDETREVKKTPVASEPKAAEESAEAVTKDAAKAGADQPEVEAAEVATIKEGKAEGEGDETPQPPAEDDTRKALQVGDFMTSIINSTRLGDDEEE